MPVGVQIRFQSYQFLTASPGAVIFIILNQPKKCTFFEKKLLFLIAITNKFLIFVASNDKKQSLTPEEPTG